MKNIYAISNPKTHKHIGSIIADSIQKDPVDNYLLFMIGNTTIAMFEAENIEISTAESRSHGENLSTFTEYQSNRI